MKRLPNCVLRYQKDVIYELYHLLKRRKASINIVRTDGVWYACFSVRDVCWKFAVDTGNINITAQLDTFAQSKPAVCKAMHRFLQELKEFCELYDVTLYTPGVVYIGHHEVLTEFQLAAYDLYLAWQHMEYPDDEEEEW